jgi:ATP-dependent HslUV protease ATP-binding subunit HslU
MPVARAREALEAREAERMLDKEAVTTEAIRRVEETGIVFLDELDKIVGVGNTQGPDVSRGGVQRDLLPLVEGCTVQTRYGPVRTDHVLFIGAGAFHNARPEDLIPELQGRFPLRVTLKPLKVVDFARILTEPEHSLTKQYKAMLRGGRRDLRFTPDASGDRGAAPPEHGEERHRRAPAAHGARAVARARCPSRRGAGPRGVTRRSCSSARGDDLDD